MKKFVSPTMQALSATSARAAAVRRSRVTSMDDFTDAKTFQKEQDGVDSEWCDASNVAPTEAYGKGAEPKPASPSNEGYGNTTNMPYEDACDIMTRSEKHRQDGDEQEKGIGQVVKEYASEIAHKPREVLEHVQESGKHGFENLKEGVHHVKEVGEKVTEKIKHKTKEMGHKVMDHMDTEEEHLVKDGKKHADADKDYQYKKKTQAN